MTSFKLELISDKEKDLASAIEMILSDYKKARSWKIEGNSLEIYNSVSNTIFPYQMTAPALIPFVWGWLQAYDYISVKSYLGEGTSKKGFKLYTKNDMFTLFVIEPYWTYYGK